MDKLLPQLDLAHASLVRVRGRHHLPAYMRRSPKVSEVLPVFYLRGLSPGDFKEALPTLLGQEATAGLGPTTIADSRPSGRRSTGASRGAI